MTFSIGVTVHLHVSCSVKWTSNSVWLTFCPFVHKVRLDVRMRWRRSMNETSVSFIPHAHLLTGVVFSPKFTVCRLEPITFLRKTAPF